MVPQTVEVLANPECPHCLHALDRVTQLAVDARVPVAGLDILHHPEAAGAWEHSPLVRYGRATFAGVPTLAEFRRLLAEGAAKGI